MTPESVSLRDVYEIVSKVDDKLDSFIKDTHTQRAECATKISGLDKRVSIIEDRGVRFWAAIAGISGLVGTIAAAIVSVFR